MTERVVVSPAALQDLLEIVDYYLTHAGVPVAMEVQMAWERVIDHLSAFPKSGSLRLA